MTSTPLHPARPGGVDALPGLEHWTGTWAHRPALRTPDATLTYADLAARVDEFARRHLTGARRLTLVELDRSVEGVTAYLAALVHDHPVLVAAPGTAATFARFSPAVVVDERGISQRRGATELHPHLALLLATSGSSGRPKLVRLGAEGVAANAAAIAEVLGLTTDDVGATTLPLHYTYGLSVLHSHLAVGASVLLTDRSVIEPEFWTEARAASVTSLAGVPHTHDLLERTGFTRALLPSLRLLTQAGGAMPPERVRRLALQGRREGFDLVVMYGQTEATARMACLPAELAVDHPGSVGRAIPGGLLRLEPVPESDHGEIVFSGPNVMLGYAEEPADLARGRDVHELRTGDLGRWRDGLLEVVGRRDRCVKLFGRRHDLGGLERQAGPGVHLLVHDEVLHAFTAGRSAGLDARLRDLADLPPHAVVVHHLPEIPRTAGGKPCGTALRALAVQAPSEACGGQLEAIRAEYARVLGRPDARPEQSFTDLGGDSLSFVELSTRLSTHCPDLPADWHRRPLRDLVPATDAPPRRGVPLDTAVVLRALAILVVVGSHTELVDVMGGAHLLLAVAGWNLARFVLDDRPRGRRLRSGLAAVARVAIPSAVLLGAISLVTGQYALTTAAYLNNALGPDSWSDDWQLWFLEAWVWCSLAALALIALRPIDRLDRRHPFALAMALTAAALALRWALVGVEAGPTERYAATVVAWLFLAGWAGARATTLPQRLLVLGTLAAGTIGFFGDPAREAVVIGGVALLLLVPTLRVPRAVVRPLSAVAAASLGIYLTHWQVYPHLEAHTSLGATLASVAVGIAYARLVAPVERRIGARIDRDPADLSGPARP
ncbi:AMP-binding protein [Alteromonas gracilis]